jgi:hypothetical protein
MTQVEGLGPDRARRRAFLVAGMHRSGNAALARLLEACGAALPLTPPVPRESETCDRGGSDPIAITHDRILTALGSSWDDVLPLPADWVRSPAASEHRERLAAVLTGEYPGSGPLVVDDPRICRLLPLWLGVLDDLDIEPAFVLPVRDPRDVASELAAGREVSASQALVLWLRHVLEAEHQSRGRPRAFVAYEDLRRDPRSAASAIDERTGVGRGLEDPGEARLDEVAAEVARDLSRTAGAEPTTSHPRATERIPWIEKAHAVLLAACRSGEEPDHEVLDRLNAAIDEADLAYRPILAEQRERIAALRDALSAHEQTVDVLRRLSEHTARRAAEAEAKLHDSERRRRSAEDQVVEVRRALASISASASWRLTRPLRAAKALASRANRRGRRD